MLEQPCAPNQMHCDNTTPLNEEKCWQFAVEPTRCKGGKRQAMTLEKQIHMQQDLDVLNP